MFPPDLPIRHHGPGFPYRLNTEAEPYVSPSTSLNPASTSVMVSVLS